MKKFWLFLLSLFFVHPIAALAQAVDDGHNHIHGEVAATTPADPEQRLYVIIGVGVVFVLLIAWFVWTKKKSA